MKRTYIYALPIGLLLALPGCFQSKKEEVKEVQPTAAAEVMQPKAETTESDKTMTTTPSGLQYTIVKPSTNPEAQTATEGKKVTVHYTGWLADDKGNPRMDAKFDSSVDRKQPFSFMLGVGQVIKGWDEGVKGMKIGEQRRLVIPAKLGYGDRGAGRLIPPNATLVFDVELLGVE